MGRMRSRGQQVLDRVVAQLGSVEQAAIQLGVSPTLLQRLLKGQMPVPDQLLVKAMDLLESKPPKSPA